MKEHRVRGGNARSETVDRLSWDFSSCPANELYECHAYEFSRNVPLICADADNLRGVSLVKRKGSYQSFDALFDKLRKVVISSRRKDALFWFYPEFPSSPYLSIPQHERTRRMEVAFGRSEQDAKASVLDPKLLPQFLGDGLRKGLLRHGRPSIIYDATELALIEIDWRESDTYLVEIFAAWLHSNRPRGIEIYEDRGAGNFQRRLHDELKALGALRLLEKMSWTEAFNESLELIGRKTSSGAKVGLYGDREQNWKRAKGKAERIIHQMKKWALVSAAKDID